jgi:hypothetical protein
MYITIKYVGPTNYRSSGWRARIDLDDNFKGSVKVSYDYEVTTDENVLQAVQKLIDKMELNEYGTWNKVILSYGRHGYIAIPAGNGSDWMTHSIYAKNTTAK